jgi:hypothetical protein
MPAWVRLPADEAGALKFDDLFGSAGDLDSKVPRDVSDAEAAVGNHGQQAELRSREIPFRVQPAEHVYAQAQGLTEFLRQVEERGIESFRHI